MGGSGISEIFFAKLFHRARGDAGAIFTIAWEQATGCKRRVSIVAYMPSPTFAHSSPLMQGTNGLGLRHSCLPGPSSAVASVGWRHAAHFCASTAMLAWRWHRSDPSL